MNRTGRRCRRVVSEDGLRPSDVLAAFFALGIAFLLAAAAAGVVNAIDDWPSGRWLALHLAFVGGISQLVLGASMFFAGAFLATTPPPRALVRALLVAWNIGAVLVAVGVTTRAHAVADGGVVLLIAGLALLAVALRTMQRRSLQRAVWATRWYYACAAFLAVGIVAGAALTHAVAWHHGDLLGAHLALNLAGWFGTAIVGTLHTFYPSVTQTRLAIPRLQPLTFAAWLLGVAALAGGLGFDFDVLVWAGWGALAAGGALLALNLAVSTRAATTPLSLPAQLIAGAQIFLVVGLATGVVVLASLGSPIPVAGPERAGLAILLLAGWLGLTVIGSLLHLLGVLARVRDLRRPIARESRGQRVLLPPAAVAGVAALGAGRLAEVGALTVIGGAAVVAVYAVLAGEIARRAARAGIFHMHIVKKELPTWPT